jgi:hypothetical protein
MIIPGHAMKEVVRPPQTCRRAGSGGAQGRGEAAAVARKGRGEAAAVGHREDRERRCVRRREAGRGEE